MKERVIMISLNYLFLLNEGVIGRFANSISNIMGKRRSIQFSPVRADVIKKINHGTESIKRLIPRPMNDNDKIGFKAPRILRTQK